MSFSLLASWRSRKWHKWLCDLWPAGSIPSWLQGTLLRNGPGLFSVGDTEYNHWFDGMSLIHSFTFEKGEMESSKSSVISPCTSCYSLRRAVLLFQARWPTEASFWRAKPTKGTSRPTGLSSPSLEPWSTRIPAKTSSPGRDDPGWSSMHVLVHPGDVHLKLSLGYSRTSATSSLTSPTTIWSTSFAMVRTTTPPLRSTTSTRSILLP